MTQTPHRITDPFTVRVQAEAARWTPDNPDGEWVDLSEWQPIEEQEARARIHWAQFDRLMAETTAKLDDLDKRIDEVAKELRKCREDMSDLWGAGRPELLR